MLIGELFALGTAILWAFTAMLFTSAANRIGTFMLNFTRLCFASVYLIITILIIGNIEFPSIYQIFMLTVSGFIGLVIGDTFLFKSYTIMGPRITSLVFSLYPAIGALSAYLIFQESLSVYSIFGMLLTIAGISIVVLNKKENFNEKITINKKGIIFAIIAGMGQAFGLIFAKFALQESTINPLMASLVRNFTSVIMYIPLLIFLKRWRNPIPIIFKDKKTFSIVAAGSFVGPYLGITFSLLAIEHTHIGIASSIMSTVPILLLPLSVFFYKEKISGKSILGAFMAVAGVAVFFILN